MLVVVWGGLEVVWGGLCVLGCLGCFHGPPVALAIHTTVLSIMPLIGTTVLRISGVIGTTVVRIASAYSPKHRSYITVSSIHSLDE